MYKEHNTFQINRTKGLPLWRYVDFWKFLDLINNSKLFFSTVELMGDQNEGRIPDFIYEEIKKQNPHNPQNADAYKEFTEILYRKKILISSWSANESESFAMWKMYAKEKLGIGIKTSLENLKLAFKNVEKDIYIGEVNYFDENFPKYDISNTFFTFLNKHKYYEFENEVRCVTVQNSKETNYKLIDVDLNELIQEIYISPAAYDKGMIDILEFLREKHQLNFKIHVSGVNDKWL